MKGLRLSALYFIILFLLIFILCCESYSRKKRAERPLFFHAGFLLLMITKVMSKSCKYSMEG